MLVWQAHKGKIESASFAPGRRYLATATGGTRHVHLWDPGTSRPVRKLEGARWPVKAVCFAPHAPLLAAGTARGACLWHTGTWELLGELPVRMAREVTFGPGESPLFVASHPEGTELWYGLRAERFADGRPPDARVPTITSVAALDVSADGKLLATNTTYQSQLWHTAGARQARLLRQRHASNRGAIRFDPEGRRVALTCGKWVEVWPVEGGAEPLAKFVAGTGRSPILWALAWTPDGRTLLTAGNDGFVRLWDAHSGAELKAFDWGIGKLYCAAFAPDGLTCAACGEKGQVVIWDADL